METNLIHDKAIKDKRAKDLLSVLLRRNLAGAQVGGSGRLKVRAYLIVSHQQAFSYLQPVPRRKFTMTTMHPAAMPARKMNNATPSFLLLFHKATALSTKIAEI